MDRTRVAVVLGGSERVWDDLATARNFCRDHNLELEYYATNDMIQQFKDSCVAVTLHPDKLHVWMTQRRNNKYPEPVAVYSHDGGDSARHRNPHVTHRLKDWGGSVGMFGYVVARERGHDCVILCGVPMTNANHFIRGSKWIAVSAFTRAWENHKSEMLPYCRSMSGGLTEELLGTPTAEWVSNGAFHNAIREEFTA